MTGATYVVFSPPHLLKEYLGKPGYEMGGLALSPLALDALGESKVLGREVLVVHGRWNYPDGRFYLDVAVPTSHIEATTDHRWDPNARRLRIECPECGQKDGRHKRGCQA